MQRSAKLWALPSSISISDISKIYYETNPKSSSLSVYTTRCLHSNQVRCSMVCDILYSRGRQLAARGPHVARGSIQEKSSNLTFLLTYRSNFSAEANLNRDLLLFPLEQGFSTFTPVYPLPASEHKIYPLFFVYSLAL